MSDCVCCVLKCTFTGAYKFLIGVFIAKLYISDKLRSILVPNKLVLKKLISSEVYLQKYLHAN